MNNTQQFVFLFILSIIVFAGCGPSEEEQQRQEQARQDSLEQVRQQRMEQQRQDSLAMVQEDSSAQSEQNQQRMQNLFTESGDFTVQVESWRSKRKAQSRAEIWKERGFEQAFVVQHGEVQTGDVWYRIRLGRVKNRDEARQVQQDLQDEYQAQSWIASAN